MDNKIRDNFLATLIARDKEINDLTDTLKKRSAQIGDLKNKLIKAQEKVIRLEEIVKELDIKLKTANYTK